MPAVLLQRRLLVAASLAAYVFVVFIAFAVFEVPGLGIGHFFYVPIALLALATGPYWGAFAGAVASGLYLVGAEINPNFEPEETLLSAATGIRFVVYTGIGALIGWSARNNRELTRRLREHAERDFLTGLLNARAFEEALARRLDREAPFALLLADADRLKRFNDEHGHAAGNEYLRTLAATLREETPLEDEVARIGGDEFGLLASVEGAEQAVAACRRLQLALSSRGVSASFGYALHPSDGADALSLFHAADKRLYDGKLASEPGGSRAHLRSVS